jgi:plasmid stabilization system protein ParE
MPRILRTRKSREDYVTIEDYIAQTSPQNAEMIIRQFDEKLTLLAANKLIGRPRPELAANLLSWNVHRFVLFYRPVPDK